MLFWRRMKQTGLLWKSGSRPCSICATIAKTMSRTVGWNMGSEKRMRNWHRNRRLMHRMASSCLFTAWLMFALSANGQRQSVRPLNLTFDSLKGLEIVDGEAEVRTYHGQHAIHFAPLAAPNSQQATPLANRIALVNDFDFKNGTIEV